MSEQYTPTPWEVCTTDDGTYIAAVELYKTTEKNYVHGGTYETENAISIASIHAATTKKYYPQRPEAEANARRIVACVNACAGFSTDELERAKDLERERDALLAECARLKSVIGKWERAESYQEPHEAIDFALSATPEQSLIHVRNKAKDEAIEACRKVGPQEYPNKLITDGYVAAIEATKEVE